MSFRPNWEQRLEARRLLRAQPNYAHFRAFELGEGEESEPEIVPP